MLKRIFALLILALIPAGTALALPAAPAPTAATTVTGALFDKITKTTTSTTTNKAQGIQGYVMALHDNNYQYTLPLCADATMVEVNGNAIDLSSFIVGDTLVVTVQPNASADAKACIGRVVRQKVSPGASSGECLQGYQVKHEIDGTPSPLLLNQEYNFVLRFYARPTLDCDGKAYGTSPITTVVAPGKTFLVTLVRGTSTGPLMRWTLTTDPAGKAGFAYTFPAAADDYHFQITPGGGNTPGDVISFDAKVLDPNPSPSPVAAPTSSMPQLPLLPIIILVAVVALFGAGALEYRHYIKKQRSHELPEDEYRRTPRI